MNIKEIADKYRDEDGNIDYAKVDEEVNAINQGEIDKVAKKKDEKAKRKVNNAVKEAVEKYQAEHNVENEGVKTDDTVQKIQELNNKIEQMLIQSEREKQVASFKENAREVGVDDKLVDMLISSNADLTAVDLNILKTEKQKVTPVNYNVDNDNKKVNKTSDISEMIANYKKYKN